ncbi:MAG: 2,3-bisphosphoglycerate-independent phosphoglycerate mutase [Proteobacteria bacterium]|nr:2,3-bisphosphoglycerate-independent phosphoglycerate mutase [Pseudomonadota bacterium]MCP4920600.1 2,3-bisphosphoglycerate-independent phosphoglycerate mutase [Pseudomonadota bacterium]
MALPPLPRYPGRDGPVVLCILDGVGLGANDAGDAVHLAATPVLDGLMAERPWVSVAAHGKAVGLPSDADMGNSEVGHNALGAGRVFDQGAKLVDQAIASGSAFGDTWSWLTDGGTLHLLGLLSDGNVHSHIDHVLALVERAHRDGVQRLRVHVLTDGRDVDERSALGYVAALEAALGSTGRDYRIASGGGRMRLTMDRYEAEWGMVRRGWDCHVHGTGRGFGSAAEAIQALYAEDAEVTDQWLPAFVVQDEDGPVGRIEDGDGVLFWNFRGDRSIEISRAFEHRAEIETGSLQTRFAGMMQYDGDDHVPRRFLVDPPAISGTVGEHLAAAGLRTFAVSETQKYGHVTYFFNGNKSGRIDEDLEHYSEIESDVIPFDQAPLMKAREITDQSVAAIASGDYDHVRLNIANGDMVGHTGDIPATIQAMELVDACVGELVAATLEAGGLLLVTADHGNADDMVQRDKQGVPKSVDGQPVPRTSHSLNPVPFILVDARDRWQLTDVTRPGLANIGASLLPLLGLTPPDDYEPALVSPR